MTSAELRAEKQEKKEPYNPIKAKFLKKYVDTQDNDLFKEQLFEAQFQTQVLQKIRSDINTVKWIVVISFIAAIVVGILVGIQTA